jgi:hypothetical protein
MKGYFFLINMAAVSDVKRPSAIYIDNFGREGDRG